MLGTPYVIDHCLLALEERARQEAYELYISEMVRSANNSIARALGGSEFGKSWKEIMDYKPETRTADEVKRHMMEKIKGLGAGDGRI